MRILPAASRGNAESYAAIAYREVGSEQLTLGWLGLDLVQRGHASAHIAQLLVSRKLFFTADPQRLVVITTVGQRIGDVAVCDRTHLQLTERFERWQHLLATNPQCFITLAARCKQIGDLSECYRALPHVTESIEDRQHLLTQLHRCVDLASSGKYSLGSEVSHVEETIEFVASLPAEDRIRVVQATYKTGLLMASGRRLESSKSEAEIREELEQAAGTALLKFEWPQHLREAMTAGVN